MRLLFILVILFLIISVQGVYEKEIGVVGKKKFSRPGKPVRNGGAVIGARTCQTINMEETTELKTEKKKIEKSEKCA